MNAFDRTDAIIGAIVALVVLAMIEATVFAVMPPAAKSAAKVAHDAEGGW